MSDDRVTASVRGYMPAHELYLDGLRTGFFEEVSRRGRMQVRVPLDWERSVVAYEVIGGEEVSPTGMD